jgi:hypothetical protein
VITSAPRPIRGPGSARAWQSDEPHGSFYAAWAIADDDDAYWQHSGAREVLRLSNHEMAGQAGRYLAACGLLPGEAGPTVAEVASRLGQPWKDGVLDDEQAGEAALAAILEIRRDDEHLAYDGRSDSPQRRELTAAERAFLSRLAGRAPTDPRWAGEQIARHTATRAALGDGTRPQARPLTARERDDIVRMVRLIGGEYRYDRPRPGYQPLSSWVAELTGPDVARLNLLEQVITPRGTRMTVGLSCTWPAGWRPPASRQDGISPAHPARLTGQLPGRVRTAGTASITPPRRPARTGSNSAGSESALPTGGRGRCTSLTTSSSPRRSTSSSQSTGAGHLKRSARLWLRRPATSACQ